MRGGSFEGWHYSDEGVGATTEERKGAGYHEGEGNEGRGEKIEMCQHWVFVLGRTRMK